MSDSPLCPPTLRGEFVPVRVRSAEFEFTHQGAAKTMRDATRSLPDRPRRAAAWLALAALLLSAPSSLPARDAAGWVGKRVILPFASVLRVGKVVVDNQKRDGRPRGGQRGTSRIYRVEKVKGPWLWLQAEKEGAAGWVRAAKVIPYDQAIDYFTNQIRANPKDHSAYIRRGSLWVDKNEYDIAIADDNEAIRIDPSVATVPALAANHQRGGRNGP